MKRLSFSSITRKAGRMLLIAFSIVAAGGLILTGILLAYSSGKPRPYVDEAGKLLAGSLAEKTHVSINGVDQGMFITGKDETKPVLLYLHGGPGMPEYAWSRSKYSAILEDLFVVCWWEQRGSGLSFNPDIPPETMTAEQLISDTLEVARYLRRRFGREKIYLLGHSWGTLIGIQAAAQAPELFEAYIGMAQISRQLESEKLAYRYMLDQSILAGDAKMRKKLEKFPISGMETVPNAYRSLRDAAMHRYGIGTTHAMRSVVSGVFLPVMLNREYTLKEKISLWRGKWSAPSTRLWHRMIATDLTAVVPKLEIPAYFLHGSFDYTVSYSLAKGYFEKLGAPLKGFYTFDQSAHSPLFEEPEKARRILTDDILAGTIRLADPK